jgi:hypothetical protein
MKVVVDYDPVTGNIRDNTGMLWYVSPNLEFEEYSPSRVNNFVQKSETGVVQDLIVSGNYSADDMIKLKQAGVI